MLGAKTILAKRRHDGALALDGEEARLLTLLAVAYGRPVEAGILGKIRRASKHARAGDEAMAAMHIALAGLPGLSDPSDGAKRLFIADGLLASGASPRDIWTALEFDPAPLDALEKLYNPNEPRNPKGEGRESGEWTSETGRRRTTGIAAAATAAAEATAEDILYDAAQARLAFSIAFRDLAGLAPVAIPGADIFAALAATTGNAGTAPVEGIIPDHPDLHFSWTPDEGTLRVRRTGDALPVMVATLGPKRTLVDRRGRKVASLLTTGIRFDPKALAREEAESQREPKPCPIQVPDRPGNRASREMDRDYEDFVKAQTNKPPTPRGIGYMLINPVDKRPVIIDDCQHDTGTLIEIKRGYSSFVSSKTMKTWIAVDWGYQATRQKQASEGRPMEWDFSDEPSADWAREVFSWLPWLKRVNVKWRPWRGYK